MKKADLFFYASQINTPWPMRKKTVGWGQCPAAALGLLPLHTSAMFLTSPFVNSRLHNNQLTSLPAGVLDMNTALRDLYVAPKGERWALFTTGKREKTGSKSMPGAPGINMSAVNLQAG
jgi:hypothetical protein